MSTSRPPAASHRRGVGNPSAMRAHLLAEAQRRRGVITRRQALAVVREHVVDDAVRSGALVRIFPCTYAVRECVDDPATRRRAALAHVTRGALSHTDALATLQAIPESAADGSTHVTIGAGNRRLGRQDRIVVHRRRGFALANAVELTASRLVVVSLEQALVESWPLLAVDARRSALIDAVRDRRTSTAALERCLRAQPRTEGAAEIATLVRLLDAGCQSELEIWGLAHVFDHPDLPPSRAQRPVDLGDRVVLLDRAYEREMVDVELDGAAHHFAPAQRRRDLIRDERLAALGWLTLRFGATRLRADPAGVRRQLGTVLDRRRDQLGLAS